MVATRSARFSRCVLRCQGSRSPSTALMLRAACSIPPIQTPDPSKNGPSSSRYPTVNHFRPKPIGDEGGGLQPHCLRSPATRLNPLRRPHEAANWQSPALPHARDYAGKLFPALIARSIKQNSGNTSTIQTQTLRQTLKPKVKPLVYGQKLGYISSRDR